MAVQLNKKIHGFDFEITPEANANFKDYHGKWLVLYFYPKDNTPGCTTESKDFRDQHHALLTKNCNILGVSRDSIRSHQRFKEKLALPFELVSDSIESLCNYFEVLKQKSLFGKKYMGIERSTFLIDPEGVLRAEWRKVKVPGHVDAVIEKLTELQKD